MTAKLIFNGFLAFNVSKHCLHTQTFMMIKPCLKMNLFYHMLDLLQTDTISLQNGRQNTVYLIKYAYSFVLFFCFCCGNIILIVRCIYPYSLGFIHFQ